MRESANAINISYLRATAFRSIEQLCLVISCCALFTRSLVSSLSTFASKNQLHRSNGILQIFHLDKLCSRTRPMQAAARRLVGLQSH